MKTKICTSCRKELPATEEYFHKHSKGKYGLCNKCKECRSIENKLQRILNTTSEKAKKSEPKPASTSVSKLFLEC